MVNLVCNTSAWLAVNDLAFLDAALLLPALRENSAESPREACLTAAFDQFNVRDPKVCQNFAQFAQRNWEIFDKNGFDVTPYLYVEA